VLVVVVIVVVIVVVVVVVVVVGVGVVGVGNLFSRPRSCGGEMWVSPVLLFCNYSSPELVLRRCIITAVLLLSMIYENECPEIGALKVERVEFHIYVYVYIYAPYKYIYIYMYIHLYI
jgi:hypothetical protein